LVGALFFAFREAPQRPQPPVSSMPGNPSHAENPAMAALDNLPSDYNSLVQLGNQNMDKQEFAVAAECYRRALAIDGSSADVRTDYGACLHSMGLPDRAIEEFKKVLAEHDGHSIVRYNLGIVYYTQNQPDSARKYWEEYLRLDPNGPAADNARQFLQEL
jgi:Tfp pilus assembly protein PilF